MLSDFPPKSDFPPLPSHLGASVLAPAGARAPGGGLGSGDGGVVGLGVEGSGVLDGAEREGEVEGGWQAKILKSTLY